MEIIKVNRFEALAVISISIISLIICIITSNSLAYGFCFSIFLTFLILLKKGNDLNKLIKTATNAALEVKMLYGVILMIGATTSAWFSSGTVPTIMFYGFQYLQDMNFLFVAFCIMLIVSVFIGTAVGAISTVGIAILGIGRGFGFSDGILIGVIVSAAFVADKISPVSGLYNLTLNTVGMTMKNSLKPFLMTLFPTIIITATIYFILGLNATDGNISEIETTRMALYDNFSINPLLLLLPIFVVVLSFKGMKLIGTISFGLVVAMFFSVTIQDKTILQVLNYIIFGFKNATNSTQLNEILFSGGVVAMFEIILIVSLAIVLVGLFDKYEIITPIVNAYTEKSKTKFDLIFRTGVLSSVLTIVTCDQTACIVVPGKILRDKYNKMGIDLSILARTISDTGTIIAPLMMWNLNAIIIESVTGISAAQYAPYAILCYICPIVSLFIAKLGK